MACFIIVKQINLCVIVPPLHTRIDLDCIIPYLTLAKSTRLQIYYVKSGIWQGRASVQYDIFCATSSDAVIRQDFVELGAFDLI
jgi:hypothetical protein